MIQEIVYTSAPKGLKRGSRGFCTVISTSGMAANLAERLESMSGYRHAFPMNSPESHLNPVNYSHVTTRLAGQTLHVVSRVADAGQDYTGRSNKLAHHLVIDAPQSIPAGPARVLADRTAVFDQWDGSLEERPARRIANPSVPESVQLTEWEKAASDSGWAGVITEHLLTQRAPIYVLFAAGTNTLALLREVLDLLPVNHRWKTTFSTYFTRLLPGTECQLRFVLDQTQEARTLRNDARAIKIDLCENLPPAPQSDWVTKARSNSILLNPINREKAVAELQPVAGTLASDAELDAALAGDEKPSATPETRAAKNPTSTTMSDNVRVPELVGSVRSKRLDAAFRDRRRSGGNFLLASVMAVLVVGALITVGVLLWPQVKRLSNAVAGVSDATEPAGAGATRVEVEAAAQPESVPPPPTPMPFDGRSPFAEFEESNISEWSLAKVGKPAAALPLILTSHPQGLTIESAVENSSLTITNGANNDWNIRAGGETLAKLIATPTGDEGVQLHWEWAQSDFSLKEFRDSFVAFENSPLKISAPSNADEGQTEFELMLIRPQALDRHPLVDEHKDVSFENNRWKPGEPIFVKAFPEEIQLRLQGDTASMSFQRRSDSEWAIVVGEEEIAGVDCVFEHGRSRLIWHWAGQKAPSSASDSVYLMNRLKWQLTVEPHGLNASHVQFSPHLPKYTLLLGDGKRYGSLRLFELPNPNFEADPGGEVGRKSLLLRAIDPNDVKLNLHPQFHELLMGEEATSSEYRLELKKKESTEPGLAVWLVLVSTTDGDSIPIGEYRIRKQTDRIDTCALNFLWDEREAAAWGDWLRWCPIQVTVNNVTELFAQRRPDVWMGQRLSRDTLTFEPLATDPARSGNDFRGLNLLTEASSGKPQLVTSVVLKQLATGDETQPPLETSLSCIGTDAEEAFLYFDEQSGPQDAEPNRLSSALGLLKFGLVLSNDDEDSTAQTRIVVKPLVQVSLPEKPPEGAFVDPRYAPVMTLKLNEFTGYSSKLNVNLDATWKQQKKDIDGSPTFAVFEGTYGQAQAKLDELTKYSRTVANWGRTYVDRAAANVTSIDGRVKRLNDQISKGKPNVKESKRDEKQAFEKSKANWQSFQQTTEDFVDRWDAKQFQTLKDELKQLERQLQLLQISGTVSLDYGDGVIVEMIQIRQEAADSAGDRDDR